MSVHLAIDAGTSSVRTLAFDDSGAVLAVDQLETITAHRGLDRVEQDPSAVIDAVLRTLRTVLNRIDLPVQSVGITNQRESFTFLDPRSLAPLAPLTLWQERSTASWCSELRTTSLADRVRALTGLPIDPYFSATKASRVLAEDPSLAGTTLATVDALITSVLAGRAVTDVSNASRTLLFDTSTLQFSPELLEIFHLEGILLPEVVPSIGSGVVITHPEFPELRGVKIQGILGDQQASLLGQGCTESHQAKITFGTGAFVLENTGAARVVPETGLLGTIAWQDAQGRTTYALEGAIFSAGSTLQWLRDSLRLFPSYDEIHDVLDSNDGNGVTLVPSFEGLGSPYMVETPGAALFGLSLSSSAADLIGAAVESMAQQGCDVVEAMAGAGQAPFQRIRVDGGASVINRLCQLLSDLSRVPTERSSISESTAFGAAVAAAVGTGALTMEEISGINGVERRFEPSKSTAGPRGRRELWRERLHRVVQ